MQTEAKKYLKKMNFFSGEMIHIGIQNGILVAMKYIKDIIGK